MEEVGRQNMAMMERAFSLFTPFYRGRTPGQDRRATVAQEIAALRAEVEACAGNCGGEARPRPRKTEALAVKSGPSGPGQPYAIPSARKPSRSSSREATTASRCAACDLRPPSAA